MKEKNIQKLDIEDITESLLNKDENLDNNEKIEKSGETKKNEKKEDSIDNNEEKIDDSNFGFKYDPYKESNIISRLFFLWSFYILRLSRKKKLNEKYFGTLISEKDSINFKKQIYEIWENKGYKNIKSNALFKSILRANAKEIIIVFILSIYNAFSEIGQVILLQGYIDHFETGNSFFGINKLLYLGIIVIIFQILQVYFFLHTQMKQMSLGIKSSFQLQSIIYHKLLKISPSSFTQRATQGEIINFIEVDSEKIEWIIQDAPGLFINPIKIIVFIIMLFHYFGISFFAGLIILIILVFINGKIFDQYNIIEQEYLNKKDSRMKITTETFDNIKILKLYNWENKFKSKIIEKREEEITQLNNYLNLSILNITIFWLSPILVSMITIGIYQILHQSFKISVLLMGLAIFARLQDPIIFIPALINGFIDAKNSLNRIENFIRQPEIKKENLIQCEFDDSKDYSIIIENGCFSWGVKQNKKDDDEEDYEEKENEKDEIKKEKNKKSDNQKENKEENEEENKEENEEEGNEISTRKNLSKDLNEELLKKERDLLTLKLKERIKTQIEIPENTEYDIVLKEITLKIKKGEMVGIIGEVGSGKSSLLQSILNTLILLNPKECSGIYINGSIGYVSQIPWIQNDTIKNNILFFNEYNEKKYKEILELSQLNYDLSNFEGGDLTEIGEKGVNLSGGQKVRISLARILYSNPDIYLFDDPISALDANVGKKIMHNCIIKYLKGKTRIIVTHALQYLKYMDRIFYIQNGKISWVGKFEEIEESHISNLLKFAKSRKKSIDDTKENENIKNINDLNNKKLVRILKDEDEEVGEVKFDVYISYFKYMGGITFMILIMIIMFLWQLNKGGSDFWLAYWSKPENQKKTNEKWRFFMIYSALGLGSIIFIFFRIFLLSKSSVKLTRQIHIDMIDKLIKAPINLFHESIPRGQIFNRLSKDLENLTFTYETIGNLLVGFFTILGALILDSYYDIYTLIYIPLIIIFGILLSKFYLIGARQLTRFEAMSHSPILNIISESIPGITTIRAFNKINKYLEKFHVKVNNSIKINHLTKGAFSWYQEQFDIFGSFYIIYLVTITIIKEKEFSPQSIGIMFTYSVLMQLSLSYAFEMATQVEQNMISMERCLKYTEIEGEKPSIQDNDIILERNNWPSEGIIKFHNYYVKYRPNTEIVLKNLNFEIKSKEKIGIVGRTGSGKSTICLCLFRILEPLEGTIYIDNVDIRNIGLDILRKNITIIPQDPCLFEGTLKFNIDPFDEVDNSIIIKILKDIGFEYTESDNDIINKMIEQNGNNLSVGEKQLICIARALIRKSKIIVMDEATANIDIKTEKKKKKALKLVLDNCTVITVAHRIKTIINYDKILVLDNGEIVEFDKPDVLLKNQNSLFYELYHKSI